ncbi:MAG: TetR/AcrR family transcriptional regulator [Acidobacteria bacterium]|nr:TetR/AcrR family transcriptional regulator [Acidobacteriota bacterium]
MSEAAIVPDMTTEGGSAEESQTVAEKRRGQIVDAAVRLFSEKGYFQTTIEDVAGAVPVSKGLVYRYFKDKTDLLFYVLRYVLEKYRYEELQQLVSDFGPLYALTRVVNVHFVLAREHPQEVVLAYRSTKDLFPEQRRHIKVLESKTARLIRQCLEECIHHGLMIPVNTDIMAYQYIMFGHTWGLKNWAFRDRYSADEYMAEGEKILVRPFLTEAGREELRRIEESASGNGRPTPAVSDKSRAAKGD